MQIILGITGSVSAYKTPWLVRDLQRAGHVVRVVMSEAAANFVTPLALQAVSKHNVVTNSFSAEIQEGGSWHVHWAQWADAMLIAPCSAATLGKICSGIPDSPVLLVAASMEPENVFLSPAMDAEMWLLPSTQRNVAQLAQDGYSVVSPESGSLASGLSGKGRLPELEYLVKVVQSHFETTDAELGTIDDVLGGGYNGAGLAGKNCIVTAGPTVEPIDSVRSIINHSTGTMGYAVAESLRSAGALVTLISGPVSIAPPAGVTVIHVNTAHEMHTQVMLHAHADVVVMAAAVADFTPKNPADYKLKKESFAGSAPTVELAPTVDILQTLGAVKQAHQLLIGFALETENVVENAKLKLKKKNADMIVANEQGPTTGFGGTTNQVTIVTDAESAVVIPLMDKKLCAAVIVQHIQKLIEMKAEGSK